ncbi:MAG: cytochrome c biogenesis protein CcsA [Polyangiaceae bacterium]
MSFALLITTLVAYSAAVLAFYLRLVRPSVSGGASRGGARMLLVLAAGVHFLDIGHRSAVTRTCPVTSAQFGLSLAALIAVVAFLVWARSERAQSLGIVVAPVGLAMFLASEALQSNTIEPEISGWFLAAHVSANLLSVGLLVLAAAASTAYLVQSSRLKSKRVKVSRFGLPGLDQLEAMSRRALSVGLGSMTLGVVSGAVFAQRLSFGGIEGVRVTLSYACWLLTALVVVGQRALGWHGRRVAWGIVVSALLAVVLVLLYALTSGGHS